MSVSSGSDITIPIQDSPPPPPSPYANTKHTSSSSTSSPSGTTNKTSTTATTINEKNSNTNKTHNNGIDNVAYQSEFNNSNNSKNKSNVKGDDSSVKVNLNNMTQIDLNNTNNANKKSSSSSSADPPIINEAINGEIIDMNVLDSIPHKPQPEFGPYENFDEYFIAVNQHKKFLRGEKLYVTKDKRKNSRWKKYICWIFGALLLASIITISILAAVGLFPPKSSTSSPLSSISGIGSSKPTTPYPEEFSSSSEFSFSSSEADFMTISPPSPSVSDIYVPYTADVHLTLSDAEYEDALSDPNSDQYRSLAETVQSELKRMMETDGDLGTSSVRVIEFSPGSVVTKLRISWMDKSKDLGQVQRFMTTIHDLGNYTIRPGTTSYALLNNCKMGNNGCSNICVFDYESLDFLCTCPERLILGADNKTCQEPDEIFMSSSTEASNERPVSEIDLMTTTSSTTTSSPIIIPEPETHENDTFSQSEHEIIVTEPHPSTDSSASSAEHHEHDNVNNETSAVPVQLETTPSPQSSIENVSTSNDTDFDYNTDNGESLVPEVSQQHHPNDKAPLITLMTTSAAPSIEEAVATTEAAPEHSIESNIELINNNNESSSSSSEQMPPSPPSHETQLNADEEAEVIPTTVIPGLMSDAVMLPSNTEVPVASDEFVPTTISPALSEETEHHSHHNSSTEDEIIIKTIDITPRHSSVESSDDIPPTIQPSEQQERILDEPEAHSIEILPQNVSSADERNSSVTRALLKNYEAVEEVSNSNDEDVQVQEVLTTTETPTVPIVHSDEFMAFSDANMSIINNANTTPNNNRTLAEAETIEETIEEIPSSGSIESMTSYENHSEGSEASISASAEENPVPSPNDQNLNDETNNNEQIPTITIKPISLINDTAVNHMTEGITEDVVNSEILPTIKPSSNEQEEIVADLVTEETPAVQEPSDSQESNNNSNNEKIITTETPETTTAILLTPSSENIPINQWTSTVAGFINTPLISTTTPHPNPYNVLSTNLSQLAANTNSSSPNTDTNNDNPSGSDNSQQIDNHASSADSGNELE